MVGRTYVRPFQGNPPPHSRCERRESYSIGQITCLQRLMEANNKRQVAARGDIQEK